ncbi:MAG: S-methyl-5-thioribose-1-phosphate isomerase [Syntrophomonadaceae bacterium]|nr:S-methyl-5-thioribose-1-phosphate isomerase [Syntrophomonadaceae bacterium]MDD3271542.1 S-methyl-5-thioribose-1-phosphate isomerase [Syntrophomonadaceae bacterium]
MIRTLFFDDKAVMIMDQSRLPDQVEYLRCETVEEVAEAIKKLKVRGAPLIGVTAAFGLVMAMADYQGEPAEMHNYFEQARATLASTRPTAVNLFWALERIERVFKRECLNQANRKQIGERLKQEAISMYEEDIAINRAIGECGQALLTEGAQVMTICNAGALATCGYGTALGVIRAAANQGKIEKVWACETRPVLQGARLTVWELMQDEIPVTLISDNMAAYVMQLGHVNAVIAGADRIAANGDSANKIGTYGLAVLASYHQIPFYIAAPLSTLDLKTACGNDIVVEERAPDEVRKYRGVYFTVPGVDVFNPAFDITPHHLITGIITEKGIFKPPYDVAFKSVRCEE